MEKTLSVVSLPVTRMVLLSTLAMLICLLGGMGLGLGIGVLIHAVLPGHMFDTRRIVAAALAALSGLLLGGAAWGVAIGRIMGSDAGAGASTIALSLGHGYGPRARRFGLYVGLVSGLTFLVVNRWMQAAGWVVGGPGAAERATMVTVLAVGALAAAIAGGTAQGSVLAYTGKR